jgi:hypothetical protein
MNSFSLGAHCETLQKWECAHTGLHFLSLYIFIHTSLKINLLARTLASGKQWRTVGNVRQLLPRRVSMPPTLTHPLCDWEDLPCACSRPKQSSPPYTAATSSGSNRTRCSWQISFVRTPSTPIHSIDRPNTHPMTPIHSMDRPNPPPERPPKRRRTWPTGAHPPTKKIQVSTLIGKTITIDAEDTDNNMITKHKIEFKTGLPIDKFHLLVNGKQWEDDKSTIYDHNIRKDDTVRMGTGPLRGGMKLRNPFQRGPKRPRIANEASLIYWAQGLGYRI